MTQHDCNYNNDLLAKLVENVGNLTSKIQNAKALNGGFDYVVEKIDEMSEKIDTINGAIYNPNPEEGLFSKVNKVENESEKKHIEVSNKLTKLEEWKVEQVAVLRQNSDDITALKKSVEEFVVWKQFVQKIFWLVLPPSTLLIAKIVWDAIKTALSS